MLGPNKQKHMAIAKKKIFRPVFLSCPVTLVLLAAQGLGTATSPQETQDVLLGKKWERDIPWLRAMSTDYDTEGWKHKHLLFIWQYFQRCKGKKSFKQ